MPLNGLIRMVELFRIICRTRGSWHLARAVELCVRFDDQRLCLNLAFDLAGRTQSERLAVGDLAVEHTHDLGVLAGYGAFDHTFLTDYHFAGALHFAFYSTVDTYIAVGDDCTDNLTSRRDGIVHRAGLLTLISHIFIEYIKHDNIVTQ